MGNTDNGPSAAGAHDQGVTPEDLRVLDLMWQPPRRPRRGPKPALSVAEIVTTAVAIADAEGLDAVSMARVAGELGRSAMALYRYITSKDDLLVLMTDAAAPRLPELPSDSDWRVKLDAWIRAQIAMVHERPWYLELPLTTAAVGPARLHWLDRGYEALADTGLSFEDKTGILGVLSLYTLGEARLQLDLRHAAASAARRQLGISDDTPEDQLDPDVVAALNPYADFEHLLAGLATATDYPAIYAALAQDEYRAAAHERDQAGSAGLPNPDDELSFGIDIMLDGVAAFIVRRTGDPTNTPSG